MQRPVCEKCGSSFVRLQEELDGYYSHCKTCGKLNLLQSKYEESASGSLDELPDEDDYGNPINSIKSRPRRATKRTISLSYFLAQQLQHGNFTSGELSKIAAKEGRFKTTDTSHVSSILSQLRVNLVVEVAVDNHGILGGSTWKLGSKSDEYFSEAPRTIRVPKSRKLKEDELSPEIVESRRRRTAMLEALYKGPLNTYECKAFLDKFVGSNIPLYKVSHWLGTLRKKGFIHNPFKIVNRSTVAMWAIGKDPDTVMYKLPEVPTPQPTQFSLYSVPTDPLEATKILVGLRRSRLMLDTLYG